MQVVRSRRSICLACAVVAAASMILAHNAPSVSAQSAGSSISSTSGAAQWDYAAVVAGQVTNLGVQDVCPPAFCDNHDLNVVLPSPAATFYQTMTATLTIKFTWTRKCGITWCISYSRLANLSSTNWTSNISFSSALPRAPQSF